AGTWGGAGVGIVGGAGGRGDAGRAGGDGCVVVCHSAQYGVRLLRPTPPVGRNSRPGGVVRRIPNNDTPPHRLPSTTSNTNFDPKNASTSSPIATRVQRTAVGPRQP